MLLRFWKVAWGSSNIGNSGICWVFKTCCQNNLSKYHMHLLFSTWWISNKNMVCIETWTRRQCVCDLVRICLQDHIWRTCSSKEQAAWKMNEEEFKRHTEAISKNSHQQSLCLPNTDKLKSHITTHLKTKSPCMCSSSSLCTIIASHPWSKELELSQSWDNLIAAFCSAWSGWATVYQCIAQRAMTQEAWGLQWWSALGHL